MQNNLSRYVSLYLSTSLLLGVKHSLQAWPTDRPTDRLTTWLTDWLLVCATIEENLVSNWTWLRVDLLRKLLERSFQVVKVRCTANRKRRFFLRVSYHIFCQVYGLHLSWQEPHQCWFTGRLIWLSLMNMFFVSMTVPMKAPQLWLYLIS